MRAQNSPDVTDAGDPPAGPEIAIIGMSGRFPMADDVESYWRNIAAGRECFTVFTDEELIAAGEDPKVIQQPNYVRQRPVLSDIRGADAALFGISPREATLADPQQLIFCEVVWEVLESAGYGTPEHRGAVGVFAGMNISTYLLTRPNAFRMGVSTDGLMVGNDKDALATNVAYRLDLRGPAISVQTFCSTSATAIHLACASVRRGECDMALAGGVSIRVPDKVGYVYHEGDLASPDGRVRTFDINAKGSMYGDGCAVVLLKRLDRAVADRDTVLGVIAGSAVSNDGALKFSFQAPSIDGQRRAIAAAIENAGVSPADISYVEAHGTATEIGDPMEVAALTGAFGPTDEKQYCLLGSVKPNVGHLDRASGATGLIKVVQSLRHELIPGTVNYTAPNAEIDFPGSPFRVTAEPTPWPRRPGRKRIAGLNSLGTGGTNVHAILTEAPEPAPRPRRRGRWQILPVSARSKEAADLACTRLAEALTADDGLDLGDVAFSLQAGRKGFHHRRVVVADTTGAAVTRLSVPAGRLSGSEAVAGREAAFLIAGVGEQYPGMAAELYASEPTFRADVDECVTVLGLTSAAELCGLFTAPKPEQATSQPADLAALLGRRPAAAASAASTAAAVTDAATATSASAATDAAAADAHLIQPALFVAEYALARLLIRWGIQPRIMIGYSLGEYVAACLSGVLSLGDALRLLAFRAKLITSMPGGAMLAVMADEPRLTEALGPQRADLDIAVRTGSQLVLAGPADLIASAATVLRDAGIACRRLETTHAYHSRLLEPLQAELTAWVAANITPRPPVLPYISNLTGELATAELVGDPGYWARHMCETVRFDAGLDRLLAEPGLALVEIGPGRSLGALTRGHSGCQRSQWPLIVPTLPGAAESRPAGEALAETVGRLWLTGLDVDWAGLHATPEAGAGGRPRPHQWTPGRVPLPTYPFERQEYWLEAEGNGFGAAAAPQFDPADPTSVMTALPRLPDSEWISVPVWRQSRLRQVAAPPASWLVLTGARGSEDQRAAAGPSGAPWADAAATALRDWITASGGHVELVRIGDAFAAGPDGMTVRPGSEEDLTAVLRDLAARGLSPGRVVHLWSADPADPDHAEDSGDESQRRGLHALIALAKAAGDVGLDPWSLDIVTSGLLPVLPGAPPRAGLATLFGALRVIPVEYPGTRTRLIDVAPAAGPAGRGQPGLAGLLAELASAPADQVVALHGGRRWVPAYETLEADYLASVPPAAEIKRGGSYLITGGLGGIALAMAERLAADYQARLVLLTRTPVPAREQWAAILAAPGTTDEVRRRLDGLRRLATLGAEVITVAGDVARAGDVRRAVDAAWERFGALDGVLHCAAVPGTGMIQFKSPADVSRVLAPKVGGALALAQVLNDQPEERPAPDFLALFSSTVTATGGGAGQLDYCAANAFLDSFAAANPVPGCVVTAIDWGEWTWNGWTDGLDSYDDGSRNFFVEYREKFGLTFDEGWLALRRVLAAGEPHVVVSTQDFPAIVASSRRFSIDSIRGAVSKAREGLGRHARPDLSTPYTDPETAPERAIAEIWAEALGLEQVGANDNFFELGGNSLIGMEIIARVRTALSAPQLAPHSLYQAPTVGSLAAIVEAGETAGHDDDGRQLGAVQLRQSRIEQRRSMLRSGRTA